MIAHWPSLPAKLAGKVIGIEHGKYYVEYDDGDKHHNTIEQLRILKPPLYFGKLTYYLLACEQTLHLAPVVQTLDSAVHRINHYSPDNGIGFSNTYPLDSDLSGG